MSDGVANGVRAIKVGLVLASPSSRPLPSTRVALLNIRPQLAALGIETQILFEPDQATETPALTLGVDQVLAAGCEVVCFQKVRGPAVEALASALTLKCVRTVFLVCDLVEPRMARLTDATVVVTQFLASLYPEELQHKLHVVHDGIEQPAAIRRRVSYWRATSTQPVHAVLVTSATLGELPVMGSPPPWLKVTVVGRYPTTSRAISRLRDAQWRLRHAGSFGAAWRMGCFMLHPRIRCVAWHPQGVYEWLAQADIGIIPIDRDATAGGDPAFGHAPAWKVKSENRLTLKMSMALPVVATPIPAYESVVKQGENGFLADSAAQWRDCLELLRDPATRQRIGDAARQSVSERFSMASQAQALAKVFQSLSVGC